MDMIAVVKSSSLLHLRDGTRLHQEKSNDTESDVSGWGDASSTVVLEGKASGGGWGEPSLKVKSSSGGGGWGAPADDFSNLCISD